MTRNDESGVVLVNVLVVLAIAGGLMLLLVSGQDASLGRVSRSSDAAIAEQIALGAEASVVAALRRDMDTAPEIDHLGEAWAVSVIQEKVDLPTGAFSVQVSDHQAKYDINQLADLTAGTQAFAQRLTDALDLPAETPTRIGRILRAVGPIRHLNDLAAFGISQNTIDTLSPHVTALPVSGTVNLNSVGPFLLTVMLQNQTQARQLIRLRDRQGAITVSALREAGILRPQNSGFTSDIYEVDVQAEAGTARLRLRSLVVRQDDRGAKSVTVLERRFLYDLPQEAPL